MAGRIRMAPMHALASRQFVVLSRMSPRLNGNVMPFVPIVDTHVRPHSPDECI